MRAPPRSDCAILVRAPLDRVDPGLSASGQRLARRGVPASRRGHRRPRPTGVVMPAAVQLASSDEQVVVRYLAAMQMAGRKTGPPTTRAARSCQSRVSRAGGWDRLTADRQIEVVGKARSFASGPMVTGQLVVDADLISILNLRLGHAARSHCREDYHWFSEACARVDVHGPRVVTQWKRAGQDRDARDPTRPGQRRRVLPSTRGDPAGLPAARNAEGGPEHRRRDQPTPAHPVPRRWTVHLTAPLNPLTGVGDRLVAGHARLRRHRLPLLEQVTLSLRPNTVKHSSTTCAASVRG